MKTTLIIIIALLALLLLQRECSRTPLAPPVPDTIRMPPEIIYDSFPVIKTIPKPYPEYIIVQSPPPVVDTAAIIASYFTLKIYKRTLLNDSTAFISLIDTLYNNELFPGILTYTNRRPVTIHETYIINPPDPARLQLYAGGFVSGNANTLGAGPIISLKTKSDHLYGLGYDAVNKTAHFNMQWKINVSN
jgi:hypothetical protein